MDQSTLFDKAFKLFQSKDFKKAVKAFADLLENDAVAPWMKQKLKGYKAMAEANLKNEKIEEPPSLKMVSYLTNEGKYKEADTMLEKLDVADGDKAFLRAEMAAEQEKIDESIELLELAIEANPANRGYALNSPSFSKYIKEEEFQFLRSQES